MKRFLRLFSRFCPVIFMILIMTGCDRELSKPKSAAQVIRTSAGVSLHFNKRSDSFFDDPDNGGWIKNNNNYPVKIKSVWASEHGEVTISVDSLDIGEKKIIETMTSDGGFLMIRRYMAYIYKDGVEVGFLKSDHRYKDGVEIGY